MKSSQLKFINLDNHNESCSLICSNKITLFIVLEIKNKNKNFVCIKEFSVAFCVAFSFRE